MDNPIEKSQKCSDLCQSLPSQNFHCLSNCLITESGVISRGKFNETAVIDHFYEGGYAFPKKLSQKWIERVDASADLCARDVRRKTNIRDDDYVYIYTRFVECVRKHNFVLCPLIEPVKNECKEMKEIFKECKPGNYVFLHKFFFEDFYYKANGSRELLTTTRTTTLPTTVITTTKDTTTTQASTGKSATSGTVGKSKNSETTLDKNSVTTSGNKNANGSENPNKNDKITTIVPNTAAIQVSPNKPVDPAIKNLNNPGISQYTTTNNNNPPTTQSINPNPNNNSQKPSSQQIIVTKNPDNQLKTTVVETKASPTQNLIATTANNGDNKPGLTTPPGPKKITHGM